MSPILLLLPLLAGMQEAAPRAPLSLSSEDRRTLDRLALGRARRATFDAVGALPLRDDLTIAAWAAQSALRERALRSWSRARQKFGGARVYSDGSCDVQVVTLPEDVGEFLLTWNKDNPPAPGEPDAAEILKAAGTWKRIWCEGRAELSEREKTQRPEGWEDVSAEGIQTTRLAAAADAARALLDEAGRLRVTASRRLDGFLNSSDALRTGVLEALKKRAKVQVETAADGVAEARASLPVADLLHELLILQAQHPSVEGYAPADLRSMALLAERQELSAVGLAVPSAGMIQKPRFTLIEYDAPAWSTQTLTALGRFEPVDDERLPESTRIELARIDGMDKLRQKVEALVLPGNFALTDFLGYRQELKDDVVIFLSGARPVSKPRVALGGAVELDVELPLARLWQIVRRGSTLIDIDPAGGTPAHTPDGAPTSAPSRIPAATQPGSRPASQPSGGLG